MRIFKRISDIVAANLNELVDSFEDPERMLRQAIREMEDSIEKATQETANVLANEKKLVKELKHNQTEAQRWGAEAEKAVYDGDDERARTALVRKLERENLVVALQDQIGPAKEASKTLVNQLEGMKSKLAEAKRSLATLSARKKAAEVRKKANAIDESSMLTDDNAFGKFDRMREKVEQAEAEAEALAELRGRGPLNAPDEKSKDIDAQLEALKANRKASD